MILMIVTESNCVCITYCIMQTGRYAANVGLTWPVFPGSPSGLPSRIPTMAEILKGAGYATAMSGKWHLGNSQWKQTPAGRGFDVHVGSYSWGIDHFSKQFHQLPHPVAPLVTDWVRSYANGTYHHWADPRHSTDAVTGAALEMLENHAAVRGSLSPEDEAAPLFLYVSFIAAHSPLQPAEQDVAKCAHIDQIWRRQYCGLVVGLDRAVAELLPRARELLGPDTLVVLTSDNGGSSWFGGMNAPFRGEKTTPLQGGVLVPALLLDLSPGQQRVTDGLLVAGVAGGRPGSRRYDGLMHVSDWCPTLLGLAGLLSKGEHGGGEDQGLGALVREMDGMDLSAAIRQHSVAATALAEPVSFSHDQQRSAAPVRQELLLDMFYEGESCFFDAMEAYIFHDLKYIRGVVPDSLWYRDPPSSSAPGAGAALLSFDVLPPGEPAPPLLSRRWVLAAYVRVVLRITEFGVRAVELLLGSQYGTFDTVKLYLVHSVAVPHIAAALHELHSHPGPGGVGYYLFNLTADPYERHNLYREDHEDAVAHIERRLAELAERRPLQQKYWMQLSPTETWPLTFRPAGWGLHSPSSSDSYRDRKDDTSALRDGSGFIHPWYSDLLEESELTTHDDLLVSSIEEANRRMQAKSRMAVVAVAAILFCALLSSMFTARRP